MIVGIPKETWSEERRVALTPAGVHALANVGHEVIIQSEAGSGCGFSPEAYQEAGARTAFSAEEVFARADLIAKVMPPTAEECEWLGSGRFLFSGVHFGAANPRVHDMLAERHTIGIGLELIEDSAGNLPVLTAMSEIAGMLLPQIAGRFLESGHGGRGVMLGGVAGIPSSYVVIVGAGTVGSTAARAFLGAGASVTVLDGALERLRRLLATVSEKINTALATPYNIERSVRRADVVVGAVLIHGRRAPHVLTEALVAQMRAGSVILDVSIDQGGCVETSRPTTLSDPVFKKHGITHYCVPNIPSSVARTASHALNNVLLAFIEQVADEGVAALRDNGALRRGLYTFKGNCTHEGLAGLLDKKYVSPDSVVR